MCNLGFHFSRIRQTDRRSWAAVQGLSHKSQPKKTAGERGQSMVELAISLVILLLLLTVIVDGARILFTYMALRDAAQEGSLYGSIEPDDSNGITARVRNASDMVRGFGAGPIGVQVQVTYSGAHCAGNTISVKVTYATFPLTMPLIGAFIGSQTVPISATANDAILRPGCP
jgi:Flp pilus assembly protein TadG